MPTTQILLNSDAFPLENSDEVSRSPIKALPEQIQQMEVGGLDKEIQDIFRRAFIPRLFPPSLLKTFGEPPVRGILLYGPPGCGKTLMARQIGKLLNGKEPKIVNGPEIFSKFVGEAEANIRKLFLEAEEEYKLKKDNSGLHVIVFDEIDAICKKRGRTADSSGVNDSVVNQLLSKIDGVNELNNILIIGMTNRKDLLDVSKIFFCTFLLYMKFLKFFIFKFNNKIKINNNKIL